MKSKRDERAAAARVRQLQADILTARPGGVVKITEADMQRLAALMPKTKEQLMRDTWRD